MALKRKKNDENLKLVIKTEMCRLYGKFLSYLRRVLCKTRLIFLRINGPNVFSESNLSSGSIKRRVDHNFFFQLL